MGGKGWKAAAALAVLAALLLRCSIQDRGYRLPHVLEPALEAALHEPMDRAAQALALLPEGEEAIERFIRSKCKGKPLDRETQRKLAAALQRRGFSWQEIRPVLNRLGEEMAEE